MQNLNQFKLKMLRTMRVTHRCARAGSSEHSSETRNRNHNEPNKKTKRKKLRLPQNGRRLSRVDSVQGDCTTKTAILARRQQRVLRGGGRGVHVGRGGQALVQFAGTLRARAAHARGGCARAARRSRRPGRPAPAGPASPAAPACPAAPATPAAPAARPVHLQHTHHVATRPPPAARVTRAAPGRRSGTRRSPG